MDMAHKIASWVPNSLIESRLDCIYNSPDAVEARRKITNFENVMSLKEISIKVSCGPFGSTLTAAEQDYNGDIVLVQPTDISNWTFTFDPGWYINTPTLIEKKLPIYPANSLLFARVGNPYCCVLPERIGKATISSSMIAAEINCDIADPYYLQCYFQSKIGLTLLYSIQKTTAQPTISTQELSNFPIPIPEMPIQRALGDQLRKAERLKEIAHLLDASDKINSIIDNSIEKNRLLSQGKEINQWLKDNPSPYTEREN